MLQAIICNPDGSKRVIVDGVEYAPADAGLNAAEWREVEAATYVAPVVPVPLSISRFQARAALYLAGLLDDVEALMSHPDTPMLAKLAWADAKDFERDSPTVAAMADQLGWSPSFVDELFVTGGGIKG